MIKMGAKRSRTTKQLSPISCDSEVKSSPTIASAVKVASSEDLLIQILLLVPIKTLMGFKSVSKQWLYLITDPRFIRLRYPLPPSASALFFPSSFCRSNPDYQFIPLDISEVSPTPFKTLNFTRDPLGSGISVLQSCNGLLLCASHQAREFNRRYYVYNPTTRQFATLPKIRREYSKNVLGMSLAFDPSKSPSYKVVCVRTFGKLKQIEIYSSETQLWRVSGEPFTAPKYMEFGNSRFWNGSVHWWNNSFHNNTWRDEPYSLYFKVDEERVEQLPMPVKHISRVQMYLVAFYLGESEGHWHLIEVNSDFTSLFDVYEMAIDHSGWFVKYQVDLSAISSVFPEIIKNNRYGYAFNIISLVRRGKEEDDESFLVLEIPGGKFVRYNLMDKSVKKLWESAPIGYKFYNEDGLKYGRALPYIESLACV
ncbi:F-box domain [Heracleum sosnowskyi]|uniref:F-box domain n=1 Tax=Heracleum sosnowskyi TaxID=360622 RepID=A0AAD8J9K5_9APIA|nr:F-box domain [Heracleum sosnowskyi]